MTVLRWLPRLLIPVLVAGALAVDSRIDRSSATTAGEAAELRTQVTVPPSDALTSSWFCPVIGMRAVAAGRAEAAAELLLTNLADTTASASVELRGATTGRHFVTVEVAPRSTRTVNASDYVDDELTGALVEASSGGLAVTRRFVSPLGIDEARCSSLLSDVWYASGGDTQADALHSLAIMNPLPRDSIVDVTFATEAEFGPFVVPALRGLVVPAWSTVVIDVGEHARRRDIVAAAVRARTGRVAVDSFVAYDGSVGRRGLSVELASASLSEQWLVPVAGIDDHTRVWLRVFNPTDEVAEIVTEVVVDGSVGDHLAFAVASHDVVELSVEAPSDRAPGLTTLLAPPGVAFGLTITSSNGAPTVVWTEVLVGSAANPLTDLPIGSDAPLAPDVEPAVQTATVVAQTGETTGPPDPIDGPGDEQPGLAPDVSASETASGLSAASSGAAIVEPVFVAQSGLALVPGVSELRRSWLTVVPTESRSEALLTVQMEPLDAATGSSPEQPDDDGGVSVTRRVLVGSLAGETVAVIDVPASGIITHRLASGTVRLLTSDTPFAAILWQARAGGAGLTAALPLGW